MINLDINAKREKMMDDIRKSYRKSKHESNIKSAREYVFSLLGQLTEEDLKVIEEIENEEARYFEMIRETEEDSQAFSRNRRMKLMK